MKGILIIKFIKKQYLIFKHKWIKKKCRHICHLCEFYNDAYYNCPSELID